MFTTICTLTFRDGQTVSAQIDASSANADYPIKYSGAVDRLAKTYGRIPPPLLKSLFKDAAKKLDAELTVSESGRYDRWAE